LHYLENEDFGDDGSSWRDDEEEPGEAVDDGEDSTVPCPCCQQPIYDAAPRCPHCEQYISDADSPPAR
jgi:hypothetical protein